MAFSKIILNGTVLMDVTGTGAGEDDVTKGKRFTDVRGLQLTGKTILTRGGIEQDENGYLVISEDDNITSYYTLEQINEPNLKNADISGIVVFSGTRFRPYLFRGNTAITGVVANNITTNVTYNEYGCSYNSYAFENCTGLKSIEMTNWISLNGDYIFKGCTNLEDINIPWKRITGFGSGTFQNCSKAKFQTVVMPKFEKVFYAYDFGGCLLLQKLDVGSASQTALTTSQNIQANAFNGATGFNTLILRQMTVRPLANISAFTNTPFASGKAGGTLYVPQALVSSYQAATNWKTILGYTTNSIQAIEGSEYEHYYADGTEVPTE